MNKLRSLLLSVAVLITVVMAAPDSRAQVTNGKKPDLPAPFASKSENNAAEEAKPPKGFMPTVPAGIQNQCIRRGFQTTTMDASGAERGYFFGGHGGRQGGGAAGSHTGSAQQNEVFVSGLKEPFGIVFHDDYVYVGDTNELLALQI